MRHLSVPPLFAAGMSTAYDGTALVLAGLALRHAQAGLSGAAPRTWVWAFAGVSAWLNAQHVPLGHEPRAAIVGWAALPIAAVVVFDLNTRWERRKALSRAGRAYPTPLPSFGALTWLLFPFSTLDALRVTVKERREALANANSKAKPVANVAETVSKRSNAANPPANANSASDAANDNVVPWDQTPARVVRTWAREQGIEVSDRARISRDLRDRYHVANGSSR